MDLATLKAPVLPIDDQIQPACLVILRLCNPSVKAAAVTVFVEMRPAKKSITIGKVGVGCRLHPVGQFFAIVLLNIVPGVPPGNDKVSPCGRVVTPTIRVGHTIKRVKDLFNDLALEVLIKGNPEVHVTALLDQAILKCLAFLPVKFDIVANLTDQLRHQLG